MYNTNNASPDTVTGAGRFQSDTQKLMHRHLQDKDHVITDEELKSLRVGMAPAVNAGESPLPEEVKTERTEKEPLDGPVIPQEAVALQRP